MITVEIGAIRRTYVAVETTAPRRTTGLDRSRCTPKSMTSGWCSWSVNISRGRRCAIKAGCTRPSCTMSRAGTRRSSMCCGND